MIYVGLWFLIGVMVYAVAIWINPDGYEDKSNYGWDGDVVFLKSFGTLTVWPLAILFYAANQFRKVLLRSKKEKLKARAELEKELATARREVEDLLNGIRR